MAQIENSTRAFHECHRSGRRLRMLEKLPIGPARALGVQSHYMNAIVHIDDAIAALTAELDVYDIVDDDPPPVAERLQSFVR